MTMGARASTSGSDLDIPHCTLQRVEAKVDNAQMRCAHKGIFSCACRVVHVIIAKRRTPLALCVNHPEASDIPRRRSALWSVPRKRMHSVASRPSELYPQTITRRIIKIRMSFHVCRVRKPNFIAQNVKRRVMFPGSRAVRTHDGANLTHICN